MKQFYEERTIPVNEETLALYPEQFDLHNIHLPFSQAWSELEEQEVMYGTPSNQSSVSETIEPYNTK